MNPGVVRSVLERSGLTMSQLAADAGMSRASISEYLHGHRNPSLRQLERLAAAAGFTVRVVVHSGWHGRRKLEFEDVLQLADALPYRPPPEPPTWSELTGR